jgi:arylsulfatase A-like enzyme
VVLLLAVLGSCAKPAPPNILVVLIDTLRADKVGASASDPKLTPFLASLAERGYFFQNAYAQSSWTNPSVGSLLTSRYQSQHHLTSFQAVLSADEVSVAEILQQHGYATGGFLANFLLRSNLGFGQGFDRYQTYSRTEGTEPGNKTFIKARADRINSEALSWLDQIHADRPQAPVFLYLHYMEPHNPYDPPDELLDRVLAGRPRPDQAAINERMMLPNVGRFTDEQLQAVKDLYDAEVMSIDASLRALFKGLEERHFLDNSIVVVLADHGEEFREHGLMGHHQTLYEEVLRVPLIVLVPGHTSSVSVAPIVSVTDVAPTLLDLAGIPAPETFEGGSLRGAMGIPRHRWWPFGVAEKMSPAGIPTTGVAYSELIKDGTARSRPHERALINGKEKIIADVDGEHEYYDLRADPGETNPNGLESAARARLTAALNAFVAHTASRAAPAATHGLDAETRERMRALGYSE